MLIVNSPRFDQPTALEGIDSSHWLWPLVRQGVIAGPTRDATIHNRLTTATALPEVVQIGAAVRLTGSGGYVTAPSVADSTPWTMLSFGVLRAGAVVSAVATMAEAPGNSTVDRSLYIGSGGQISGAVFDGSSRIATTSGSMAIGKPTLIAAVATSSTIGAYLAGELTTAASTSTGFTGYTSPEWVLGYGYMSGATQASNWSAFYSLLIRRALTLRDLIELDANPWAIFQPTRIWIPPEPVIGGDASVSLSGQASTASAGTLASTRTVPASGQAATASAGTVSPSRTVALSGQAVTASAGAVVQSKTAALSGQAVTASAGTLAQTRTLALSGQAATVSAGTITYAADGNITVALSGAAVTASAGTLAPARTVATSGTSCAASAGTMAPGRSLACGGSQITTSAGTLALGIVVPLAGQAAAAGAGTVTYSTAGAVVVALTGQAVEAIAGMMSYAQLVLSAPPIGHGPAPGRRTTSAGRSRPAQLNSRTR